MSESRYVVAVERFVSLPVIACQPVRLQSDPEIAPVRREQRLRATHEQLPSSFRQVIIPERGGQCAEMRNAVVPCEHPEVSLPISMDIVAEIQHAVVVLHLAAFHVDSGESLHATAPDGMAHRVFDQPVVGAEVVAFVVEQPHFGMFHVRRIVDALDAVANTVPADKLGSKCYIL